MDQPVDNHKKDALSKVAETRRRDEKGHFLHDQAAPALEKNGNDYQSQSAAPVSIHGVKVGKTSDDSTLVDVHVNNPLEKMMKILEDIKKQKAFTFDIKGSLGVAGIFLVITTFGIFGGTKAFCSKGTQSHIGRVMVLSSVDEPQQIALVQRTINAWNALVNNTPAPQEKVMSRVVLIQKDETVYKIIGGTAKTINAVLNTPVILTGEVDSCSQTITLKSSNDIQEYFRGR